MCVRVLRARDMRCEWRVGTMSTAAAAVASVFRLLGFSIRVLCVFRNRVGGVVSIQRLCLTDIEHGQILGRLFEWCRG